MKDIKECRKQIDTIDAKLRELFLERMEVVREIAEYKKENSLPANDPKREEEILRENVAKVDAQAREYYKEFQQELFRISKRYQKAVLKENEPFLGETRDYSTYVDNAFLVSKLAKKDALTHPETINATIGSLYGKDGLLSAFDSVYNCYARVPNRRKASYAAEIGGNPDFNEAVFDWVNRLDNIHLPHRVVATPGGTGAISLVVANTLSRNETLLIPSIAWGSYRLMAAQHSLKVKTYELFDENGITLKDIKAQCEATMDEQNKVVIILNDPCQNPTGATFGKERWQNLMDFFTELSKRGPVIILNDIAYFDYARDYANITDYMECFNQMSDNMAIVIAFSTSKSLTAYGMRLGAAIILAKQEEKAVHLYNSFLRTARSSWSNVNNGFMDCFVDLIKNHKEEYLSEKLEAQKELLRRADIFLAQADEVGLDHYPYSEGFFITLKVENDELAAKYHNALMEQHIYTVKFHHGIRIAICGLPYESVDGLAYRIKAIFDSVQ